MRGKLCKLNEVQEGISVFEEKADEVDRPVFANVKIKPCRHKKISRKFGTLRKKSSNNYRRRKQRQRHQKYST